MRDLAPPSRSGARTVRTGRARLPGLDAARGVAVVGMVMAHVGPRGQVADGAATLLYRASEGRASILFVVIAGIGVSLLAGDAAGRTARSPDVDRTLFLRALLLAPAGLALQTLDHGVAVILQSYGLYFLVALAARRWTDRTVLGVSGLLFAVGPLVVLATARWLPGWSLVGGDPAAQSPVEAVVALVVTGYYPLVTWSGPLLVGLWLGRRDLARPATAVRMAGLGAAVAALGLGLATLLDRLLTVPAGPTGWAWLPSAAPFSQMPLWLLSSTGSAVAVVGLGLLADHLLPRVTAPLAAIGQLALTLYVGHLLVLAWAPALLVRDAIGPAWVSVGRATLVAGTASWLWRRFVGRGPLEALLRSVTRPAPPRPV